MSIREIVTNFISNKYDRLTEISMVTEIPYPTDITILDWLRNQNIEILSVIKSNNNWYMKIKIPRQKITREERISGYCQHCHRPMLRANTVTVWDGTIGEVVYRHMFICEDCHRI